MDDQQTFDEIIKFAIEREEEAVEFYRGLQEMVSFKSKKEMLRDIENMEKGHIVILQNIRSIAVYDLKIPKVENLAISDYLVHSEPGPDMSYQDILVIAMKKEEMAQKMYSKLAEEAFDDKIKKLFLKLSSEEAKHKLFFEKIYDDEVLTEN